MFSAIALFLAQAYAPGVTHLNCSITDAKGRSSEWQVTLNETNGMVDYFTPVSGPQRKPARFTNDTVYFIGFTLSRVDLSIRRPDVDMQGNLRGYERGQCRIATPPQRAF